MQAFHFGNILTSSLLKAQLLSVTFLVDCKDFTKLDRVLARAPAPFISVKVGIYLFRVNNGNC